MKLSKNLPVNLSINLQIDLSLIEPHKIYLNKLVSSAFATTNPGYEST